MFCVCARQPRTAPAPLAAGAGGRVSAGSPSAPGEPPASPAPQRLRRRPSSVSRSCLLLGGGAALEHAGAELILPGVDVLGAPLEGARGVGALAGLHDRADDPLVAGVLVGGARLALEAGHGGGGLGALDGRVGAKAEGVHGGEEREQGENAGGRHCAGIWSEGGSVKEVVDIGWIRTLEPKWLRIISYYIISYHIISYHIILYYITSY